MTKISGDYVFLRFWKSFSSNSIKNLITQVALTYGRYFEMAQKVIEGDLSHDGIWCILYACDFGMAQNCFSSKYRSCVKIHIQKSHAYNMQHIPSCDKSPSMTFWAISKYLPYKNVGNCTRGYGEFQIGIKIYQRIRSAENLHGPRFIFVKHFSSLFSAQNMLFTLWRIRTCCVWSD